jgi:hypothetical protein
MIYKVDATMAAVTDASRSIQYLADFLQNNLSALIRGNYVPDGYR